MQTLVVDDHELSCNVLCALLKKLGHTTCYVYDAESAIGLMQQSNFSLVITDWLMPKVCGCDFIHAIRTGQAGEHHKDIPIIVTTADVMRVSQDICKQAGATAMLPKPVMMQNLQDILADI